MNKLTSLLRRVSRGTRLAILFALAASPTRAQVPCDDYGPRPYECTTEYVVTQYTTAAYRVQGWDENSEQFQHDVEWNAHLIDSVGY